MLLAISAVRVGSSTASVGSQLDIKARSLFPKLLVTSVTQVDPRTVRVWFRNDYDKDITAIVFSLGPGSTIRRDYLVAEAEEQQRLGPGATDDLLYTVEALTKEIVAVAVLFSDMTREGDKGEIKGVLDTRRGMKIQFARFNPELEKLAVTEPSLMMKELGRLEELAASLPIEADDGSSMSNDLEHGLRNGQRLILSNLSKLEAESRDERVETFYARDGSPLTTRREARVEEKLKRIKKDFKGLQGRL